MTDTITKTQVSVSEEEKANQRFEELRSKEQLNDEEKKEVEELKKAHSDRVQKRIDEAIGKAKAAEYKYGEASKQVEELKAEIEKLKAEKQREPVKLVQDYVDIGGKRYPTDETLISMVKNGEITDADAYKIQRQRDKAELREEILVDIDTKKKKESEEEIRKEDQARVLKEYPQFSDRHPNFNPDDPLYKEVNRIWNNGYAANPRGLSLAIEDARRILRISDKRLDLTDDLSVHGPGVPERGKKDNEVSLTEEEKESAVRMYTMGENPPVNPRTGRPYTSDEAIKRAQEAKNKRAQSRRV